MKHLKSLIAASVLAFSLSVTAFAGDMQGPGIAQPSDTEPGVTQGPGFATTGQESGSDAITDTAISILKLFVSIL